MRHISIRQALAVLLFSGGLLFLAFWVQLRLFLVLIIFLAIVLFYTGLVLEKESEVEFEWDKIE